MLSKGKARPPRRLVALIGAITVVPLLTLLWLGWRLLDQDRVLERQQVQQRVERAADLIVAELQRRILRTEQELLSGNGRPGAGAGVFAFFTPRPEAPNETFVEGEDLELRQRNVSGALRVYGRLAESPDRAVVAGALLRVGRSLRKSGRIQEALAAYERLADIDDVSVSGVPAGLVGMYARGKLLEERQRASELRAVGMDLDDRLQSGRWPLTPSIYALYIKDAVRWSGTAGENEGFAIGLTALWQRWNPTMLPQAPWGRETIDVSGQQFTVLWQRADQGLRFLLATRSFVNDEWLAEIRPIARAQQVRITIDRLSSPGLSVDGADHAYEVRRQTTESGLPWNLAIASVDPPPEHSAFVFRRYLLIAGLVLLLSMALMASYLIMRAVNRELAVARLQSDFVAAVSHEFRTPLTTLRQFTDMLKEQPSLSAERRDIAYRAQSRATERLTRLVESILDFGRMEAGAHHYRFQKNDCAALVRRIVDDFSTEARAAGHEIAFRSDGAVLVDVDEEALTTAVRNLLDNATKYSPTPHTIEVGLDRRNGDVRISVQDRGIGIPTHEQAEIFTKFHRGDQARMHGIKGTGIGLTMVQEIVRDHRGRIEVESTAGAGSRFTIVLPVKD